MLIGGGLAQTYLVLVEVWVIIRFVLISGGKRWFCDFDQDTDNITDLAIAGWRVLSGFTPIFWMTEETNFG